MTPDEMRKFVDSYSEWGYVHGCVVAKLGHALADLAEQLHDFKVDIGEEVAVLRDQVEAKLEEWEAQDRSRVRAYERLKANLAEAQADSERLEFWIAHRNDGRLELLVTGSWWFHVGPMTHGPGKEPREAIDAAREGESE